MLDPEFRKNFFHVLVMQHGFTKAFEMLQADEQAVNIFLKKRTGEWLDRDAEENGI